MDSLYVKTNEGLVKLSLGNSGGGLFVTTRESKTLSSSLPAGTAYEVPEHEVGSAQLAIVFNGVLCKSGEQYEDLSSTTIKFTFDLPIGSEIDAISFEGGLNALSKALS